MLKINPNSRLSSIGGETNTMVSKIQNSIYSNRFIILFLIILFSVIAGVYYYYRIYPNVNIQYKPNSEKQSQSNGNGNGKSVELLFFYVNWCPYCKTAKPVWDELKKEYEYNTINGYNVIFTDINCTEESADVEKMISKYNIEGYPTIKLLKDGQVIEYDAKPTKETLLLFLNTYLSNQSLDTELNTPL